MSRLSIDLVGPAEISADVLFNARAELWSRGWCVLPGLLPTATVEVLRAEAARLLDGVPRGSARHSATDDSGDVLVMNGLDTRSELLFDFARHPSFTRIAQTLLGKSPMPIHTEYFGKPRAGALPTPPHQDQIFYQDHFSDEPAITFWCPLQDVRPGHGALEYGSPCPEQGELLAHGPSDAVDFGAQLRDADGFRFTAPAVPVGACLVHHGYTVHRSGPMTAAEPRHVFAFNFRGSSFREHLAAQGAQR
jgi:Phytanoyl-CoA dioxygenase (PhyH)